MDIIEKFLRQISYKFPKGYPDITDEQDMLMLEGILKKMGIDLKEASAKKPYEYLNVEARKVADKIRKELNLPKEEIKADAKNRIIIFTDRLRKDIFKALEELGYERDWDIPGSSAAGFKDPESGIEIIHKNISGVGDAGLENESNFIDAINAVASKDNPITVIIIPSIKGPTLTYKNVTHAEATGKKGEKLGWKEDALLHSKGGNFPISLKKDKDFRWSSNMESHGGMLQNLLLQAQDGGIKGEDGKTLELRQIDSNPRVLSMWNPDNNSVYGRAFILNVPGLDIEDVAFGPNNADVVEKTFDKNDFSFENNVLTIKSSKNYKEVEDFDLETDIPVFQLERNASKANKKEGVMSRGITLRTVPRSTMIKTLSGRGNNFVIDYKDIP
jgi:hypothetical protein